MNVRSALLGRAALFAALIAQGCSSSVGRRLDVAADAVADAPAPIDAFVDTIDAADACATTMCGAACVDLRTDPRHCGACRTACPGGSHVTPRCDGRICVFACDAGYHACGTDCVDDTSPLSCGSACAPCGAPANGAATCTAGACGFVCDAGYVRSAMACDAAPPRQIAPLSTATVTSRRPTLRWALAAGTDGARVDICRDRACTVPIVTFDVRGSTAAPAADLPGGVVFWRLHGRVGTSTGLATGPVWQFWVGARSAAVNTSWGTTVDINGDGYADVVVGANGARSYTGAVYVYVGSATGLATAPTDSLAGRDGVDAYFGGSVASAGDVNGDGYADIVVGAWGANFRTGAAYVYLGSATGLSTAPTTSLTGLDGTEAWFGLSVASAGDVNGDGYADVLVGASRASANTGAAYVYLGSATGLATTPATSLAGRVGADGYFGISAASAGDVNGDGYSDIVAGAPGESAETGAVYVYLGSATGVATTPAISLTARDGIRGDFGFAIASPVDVNGDGYADIAVGAYNASVRTGAAYVYLGSATGLATTPATSLTGRDAAGWFGISAASAGDVNGDGYADIVVGAARANSNTGAAYVYLGSATGLATAPATSMTGRDGADGFFGNFSAGAGDVNGDGYADVVVGAVGASSNTGAAYVYLGSATGLATTSVTSLVGRDGVNGSFGYAVASAREVNRDARYRGGPAFADAHRAPRVARERSEPALHTRARAEDAACDSRAHGGGGARPGRPCVHTAAAHAPGRGAACIRRRTRSPHPFSRLARVTLSVAATPGEGAARSAADEACEYHCNHHRDQPPARGPTPSPPRTTLAPRPARCVIARDFTRRVEHHGRVHRVERHRRIDTRIAPRVRADFTRNVIHRAVVHGRVEKPHVERDAHRACSRFEPDERHAEGRPRWSTRVAHRCSAIGAPGRPLGAEVGPAQIGPREQR